MRSEQQSKPSEPRGPSNLLRVLSADEVAAAKVEARKRYEDVTRTSDILVHDEDLERWYG
jgi:hypothetical protein